MITWEKVSPTVLDLANEIIHEHHPWLNIFKIGFVFRSEASLKGGATVMGNTSRVPPKYSAHLNLDFLIWLAQDEWERLTTVQRKALIDHELCHISQDGKLVSHDFEEFGIVLKRYGLWKADLFRLQGVFESACQLRFPPDEPGGVVAVDPAVMPKERGNGGTHKIEINLDKKCARCGSKGAAASGYCLECEISLKLEGNIGSVLEEMLSE